jgi:predicted PurR-regulated permease PerM
MSENHPDLTRNILGVLIVAGLIAASFWILRPFLPAAIWATMIVVFTWPIMIRLQGWLWHRRAPAVVIMSLLLLMIFVLPFAFAAGTIIVNTDRFVGWAQSLANFSLPPPPDWLAGLPLIGPKASSLWAGATASHLEGLPARLAPYAGTVIRWILGQAGSLGVMFLQFMLTVAFAAILYAYGESAAEGVLRFGNRLAGERGVQSVRLAGQAIRGVAMGVLVTAILQSAVAGIGLAVCGVPFPVLLTAGIFVLCVAQIGPGLVLIPTIIWMYWSGDGVWATVLLVWTVVVLTMDNVLRPLLIKRSAKLPLLLIFVGVVGGLIAFGLIGIFIGPIVLAVAFTLLKAWISDDERPPHQLPSTR